jgi:hypothetical protein
MKSIKRCYDISRPMPAILRQALETSGWKPFNKKKIQQDIFTQQQQQIEIENGNEQKIENEIEEDTQLLIWRGSRPSRKELSLANQWEEYFNHFPETYTITSKVCCIIFVILTD